MTSKHTKVFLTFIASFFLPSLLISQTIDNIVVTATRSGVPINLVSAPITVIDREQIELSLAKDVAQILRFEAGLLQISIFALRLWRGIIQFAPCRLL